MTVGRPQPCPSCPIKNILVEEPPRERKRYRGRYGAFCDKLREEHECFHDANCRSRAKPSKK